MATSHPTPIPPFPPGIDHQHFGSWLSGFVDGEGTFILAMSRRGKDLPATPCCRFAIQLRADDTAVLHLVRSFLGCGVVREACRREKKSKPMMAFHVQSAAALVAHVIPHFHRFPLMAKKSRDFAIWETGVRLIHRIMCRRRKSRPPGGSRHVHGRFFVRWTTDDVSRFRSIAACLKDQRVYDAAAVKLPAPRPPAPEPPTLFDGLP